MFGKALKLAWDLYFTSNVAKELPHQYEPDSQEPDGDDVSKLKLGLSYG
jgi:hypothetical protein